eukprot:gene36735-44560_t
MFSAVSSGCTSPFERQRENDLDIDNFSWNDEFYNSETPLEVFLLPSSPFSDESLSPVSELKQLSNDSADTDSSTSSVDLVNCSETSLSRKKRPLLPLQPEVMTTIKVEVPILKRPRTLYPTKTRAMLASQFMRLLNSFNAFHLTDFIRSYCSEQIMCLTPHVREPLFGQRDTLLLFSLLLESFPDGHWHIHAEQDDEEGNMASCQFQFRGTKKYEHSLENVFRQIKTHHSPAVEDVDRLLHTLSLHTPCSPAAQALEKNRCAYVRHVSFVFDEHMKIQTILATNI